MIFSGFGLDIVDGIIDGASDKNRTVDGGLLGFDGSVMERKMVVV